MSFSLKIGPCRKSKRRNTVYFGPGRKTSFAAHTLAFLSILFLVWGAVACSSSSSDKTNGVDYDDAQLQTRLETAFQSWVDTYGIYGAAAVVYSPNHMDYRFHTGYAILPNSEMAYTGEIDGGSGTLFEDDSQVRIGSATKPMTATVILQLIEEGELYLDSTLSQFVPDYPNGENITVEHLLRHRSGIPEIQLDDLTFIQYALTHDDHWFTPEEILSWTYGDTPINSLSQGTMIPREPVAVPGEAYNYSQPGYVALGLIIEKITGKGLADVFDQRIFSPLQMTDTYLPEKDGPNYPMGYTNLFGMIEETVPISDLIPSLNSLNSSAWCAGGVVSTARDLYTFLHGLLNGSLLSPSSLANMQDYLPTSSDNEDAAESGGYGMGFYQSTRDDVTAVGHDGSLPGSGCVMQYIDAYDLYIIAVRNTDMKEMEDDGGLHFTEYITKALLNESE